METDFLKTSIKIFNQYRVMGETCIQRLDEEALNHTFNESSNSIATIVKHLSGNMKSRWTDFLTSDGEKEWRDRDSEFEHPFMTKIQVLQAWNEGWDCLMNALNPLKPEDLQRSVNIRGEEHTVMEAILRQLSHYPFHVGQMVYVAKFILNAEWQSLSIPKGQSNQFNQQMLNSTK